MLSVEAVEKSYGTLPILRGVSLSLNAGETLALVGESGSGKSTLLHLIAGLDAVDAGRIRIGDTVVTDLDDHGRAALRRDRLGVIFQQFNLIQSLTVDQNIALQARLAGREDAQRSEALTRALGLGGLGGRYPEELSGGQQQRVAIARAMAAAPDMILADEPTGNLDEATGDAVLDLLLEQVAAFGTTLVLVTHSPRLAARADRTLRLTGGVVE